MPILFSLSITVGAVALLMFYPTVASLVMAVIAMAVAISFVMSYVWAMLDDRNAP